MVRPYGVGAAGPQRLLQCGGREALYRKLLLIAKAAEGGDADGAGRERQVLEAKLRSVEQEHRLLGDNLGRAKSDAEYQFISRQFGEKADELEAVRGHLDSMRPDRRSSAASPEQQTQQAMDLFEQIELIAADPDARAALRPLLKRLDLNLWWLRFAEGRKGQRAVRQLRGG